MKKCDHLLEGVPLKGTGSYRCDKCLALVVVKDGEIIGTIVRMPEKVESTIKVSRGASTRRRRMGEQRNE